MWKVFELISNAFVAFSKKSDKIGFCIFSHLRLKCLSWWFILGHIRSLVCFKQPLSSQHIVHIMECVSFALYIVKYILNFNNICNAVLCIQTTHMVMITKQTFQNTEYGKAFIPGILIHNYVHSFIHSISHVICGVVENVVALFSFTFVGLSMLFSENFRCEIADFFSVVAVLLLPHSLIRCCIFCVHFAPQPPDTVSASFSIYTCIMQQCICKM